MVDKPVATAKVSTAIYEALKAAITDGRFPPGYRLKELHIARQFGVSTIPVREALQRLDREGLVRIVDRRGAVVPRWSVRDAEQLYELRELLEGWAIERLAERAKEIDLGPVEQILKEAEQVLFDPDQQRFNRLDLEFHARLVRLSGNRYLAELAEQVHRRIQTIRSRCSVHLPGRPPVSHRQHLAILEAVRRGDAAGARAALVFHIRDIRAAVLAVLARGEQESLVQPDHREGE
jgi:DNA-binding GntR family transcriptional regulator